MLQQHTCLCARLQTSQDPFHDFLQSLDITLERKASLEPWAKSRSSLASSPPPAATPPAAASPPPTAPPANAAGGSARRAVPYLRQLHAPDAHGLNGHVMNGANGVEDVLPSPSSSDATPSKSLDQVKKMCSFHSRYVFVFGKDHVDMISILYKSM